MRQLIRITLWCLLGYLSSVSLAHADKVVLVAGGGTAGDGGQAAAAKLLMPFGVTFDGSGDPPVFFCQLTPVGKVLGGP